MTSGNTPSRRRFLSSSVGSAVGVSTAAQLKANSVPTSFGRAKAVIVLYLYGAPSQMDTLDPKPLAPVERRSSFSSIPTAHPGVHVCEHLPRIASSLDLYCLVRSMTHASNNHAVSVALSGLSTSLPVIEANRKAPQHWPYFGSVLEYLFFTRPGMRPGQILGNCGS